MKRDPELEPRFRRLIEAYAPALRRLCASYLRDSFDRQDLFQEIAFALWMALPQFRGAASERTWLYRIAHNVALGHVRRKHRQSLLERPWTDLTAVPSGRADDRHEELLSAVRRLPEVGRQIAVLYLEGLSAEEMAGITGLSPNHVAVRLSRLRRKLAQILRPEEVNP